MNVSFAGYWLAGDPAASTIRDAPPAALINKGGTRALQIVGGPAWPYQEGHDRANQWITFSFQAQKVHASTQAAEEYVLAYESLALHPWKGTVKVLIGDDQSKQVVMHDAVISPPSFTYTGKRTFATYTIQGPGFSAATSTEHPLFIAGNDALIPSGEQSPASGQGFAVSGTALVPNTSIATADTHWAVNGGGTALIPTGA